MFPLSRRAARLPNQTRLRLESLEDRAVPSVTSGLVGWWTGDDTTQDSVSGTSASLLNGAGYGPGQVADGFELDGANDYVDLGNAAALAPAGAVTLSAWFRTDAVDAANLGSIVGKPLAGDYSYGMRLGGDRLVGRLKTDAGDYVVTGKTSLIAGQWYYATMSYDSGAGTVRLYLNGEFEGSATASGSIAYDGEDVLLGTHPIGGRLYFDGGIDEVRVFDRAIAAAEVRELFDETGPLQGISPSTVAWYNYDSSGTATTLTDSSGNGYNASATGSTFVADRPPGADQILGVPLTAGSLHVDGNFGSGAITAATDLVTNAGIAAFGGLTMETWFQRDATNNNAGGLQKLFQIELENFFIPRDSDQIGWSDGITAPPLFATAAVGEWHHVAAVFVPMSGPPVDGTVSGALRLYLDGQFAYGQAETLYAFRDNASGPLYVGRSNTENETFAGELFATRITLGALNPGEFLLPSVAPPENHPPVAAAVGPYTMLDGGSVMLNGAGSSDVDNDTLSYSWTINGHAGAATGATPTVNWATLQAVGIDTAGVYDVSLTVDDGRGGVDTSATTLSVAFDARSLTDLSKALKAGRTIPIRLQLLDAAGNNISSPNVVVTAVRLQRVNADGSRTPVTLGDSGSSNPGNAFRYDAGLQGYIFNLSTKNLAAGNYEFFWMAGSDTTEHKLTFVLV